TAGIKASNNTSAADLEEDTDMSATPSAVHPPPMQINLEGRVRNLSLARRQGLRPVFEAIANSIDAIYEAKKDGEVEIRILRDLAQQALLEGDASIHPIDGFEISDIGVGSTEKNWQAFQEADTSIKAAQAGK